MEGVWLKTELIDDTYNDSLSIKLEARTDIDAESQNALDEHDPIQSSNTKSAAKHKRKKLVKAPTAESDGDTVEKKSEDKKVKRGRKPLPKDLKRSYVCDVCGNEFKKAYGLSRHKLLHSGIKPYACPVENCGAAFTQSSALKAHQMSHTGERKYFCEECGQGFFSKYHMQVHQRSKHSGERPYVCVECGQGFTRKQALTRHQLEHAGEKPFECEDCGMRFYERKLLTSHKKTHTAEGKPYVCKECGKGFYHNTSLNAHQRNHTVRPFGCEVCGKRFIQKGTLNIHKMTHSDVRPFGCEECGMRFTQKFTLKTHRMKQHGLTTDLVKVQKTVVQHIGETVITHPEPKIVSHNDKIFPIGYENIQPSDPSEIDAMGSMDLSQKSLFSSSTVGLNDVEGVTKSGFEPQPEKTIEIGESSVLSECESNYSEDMIETDCDDSTEFDDKLDVHHNIDALQPQSIAGTSLDRIKEESAVICEPSLDAWKSEPATSDDDYVSESEKPKKKPAATKNSHDESVERPFSCGKCERKFALISALKNHQRSHNQIVKPTPSFICDECGKIFVGKQNLKKHKRIHSTSRTLYPCPECGKSFTSRGNMRCHLQTHTGDRPFACETCGLTFARKACVDRHRLTHTEERNFPCDVCDMKFRFANNLKRHKLSHTGERNYGCDICGKTFIDKNYIKFHLRTHTGYKPFVCDQCPAKFIQSSDLKRHKKYSHREIGEPTLYRIQKMKKMLNSMQ